MDQNEKSHHTPLVLHVSSPISVRIANDNFIVVFDAAAVATNADADRTCKIAESM